MDSRSSKRNKGAGFVMRVVGLDGKTYNWVFAGQTCDEVENRSGLHLKARKLLKQLFPLDRVMEEVHLPGSQNLRLDFFLPIRMMAIEVHGQQHYEYSPFFHGTKMNFIDSKRRDANKKQWCQNNDINLIELPYNESEDKWTNRIMS